MTQDEKTTPTEHRNFLTNFLSGLLGDQQAVVLVVNQDEKIVDYRVQTLAEVVATLDASGFGDPLEM